MKAIAFALAAATVLGWPGDRRQLADPRQRPVRRDCRCPGRLARRHAAGEYDGVEFTAPEGQASLIVSGSLNVWDKLDEAFAIYAAPGEGETITYQHGDKQGIVISGTEAIVPFIGNRSSRVVVRSGTASRSSIRQR